MKIPKKVIEIIDEFPALFYELKEILNTRGKADYILDASNFSQPLSLLNVTSPDFLLLSIKLPAGAGIEILATEMQNNHDIELGMITRNSWAYYTSLCSTFSDDYLIDNLGCLDAVPRVVTSQQLN